MYTVQEKVNEAWVTVGEYKRFGDAVRCYDDRADFRWFTVGDTPMRMLNPDGLIIMGEGCMAVSGYSHFSPR